MENANLLVVDDHQLFRKSLVRLLEVFPVNHTFHEAANGFEALETLKSKKINIGFIGYSNA